MSSISRLPVTSPSLRRRSRFTTVWPGGVIGLAGDVSAFTPNWTSHGAVTRRRRTETRHTETHQDNTQRNHPQKSHTEINAEKSHREEGGAVGRQRGHLAELRGPPSEFTQAEDLALAQGKVQHPEVRRQRRRVE